MTDPRPGPAVFPPAACVDDDPDHRASHHRGLGAELAALEASDPVVGAAARRLDEVFGKIAANTHQVRVGHSTLKCALSCGGPAPHLDEYRAADVRPPAALTAAYRAADTTHPPKDPTS